MILEPKPFTTTPLSFCISMMLLLQLTFAQEEKKLQITLLFVPGTPQKPIYMNIILFSFSIESTKDCLLLKTVFETLFLKPQLAVPFSPNLLQYDSYPILIKYIALNWAGKPHKSLNFAVPSLKSYQNSVKIVISLTVISNKLNFPRQEVTLVAFYQFLLNDQRLLFH